MFTTPDHSEAGETTTADVSSQPAARLSLLPFYSRLACWQDEFWAFRCARPNGALSAASRRGCVPVARSLGGHQSPITCHLSRCCGYLPLSRGLGVPWVGSRRSGFRRRELAGSKASRRPAACRPLRSRRKGRGRAMTPELVPPPADSPAELLRATPPHSLAPSDTINRYVLIQAPDMGMDESTERTTNKGKRSTNEDVVRTASLRSRDSGHVLQAIAETSAPSIGAERENLIISPSPKREEQRRV